MSTTQNTTSAGSPLADSPIGAAVQSAADVDEKFGKLINSIWNTLIETCGIPVSSYKDGHVVTVIKIGARVLEATEKLFKGLAWESANVRYRFDGEHAPEDFIDDAVLADILENHLGWKTPPDIRATPEERCRFYGCISIHPGEADDEEDQDEEDEEDQDDEYEDDGEDNLANKTRMSEELQEENQEEEEEV